MGCRIRTRTTAPEMTEREARIRLTHVLGHLVATAPDGSPTAREYDTIRERVERHIRQRERDGVPAADILGEVEALLAVERNRYGRPWAQIVGIA
jgi:hypothetical protein